MSSVCEGLTMRDRIISLDLREFFASYAEVVPQKTLYECIIIEELDDITLRLRIKPDDSLSFTQKAYDLFRVIDRENGTVDILIKRIEYSTW